MESTALADAYNQAYPLSKEERDARAVAVSTDDSASVQVKPQEREAEGQGVSSETAGDSSALGEPDAREMAPTPGSTAAATPATPAATSTLVSAPTDTPTATDTATATATDTPTATAPVPAPAPAPTPTQPAQRTPTLNRQIHLYLHRPRTPTKHPVLVPLSTSSSLAAALKDRTVLEFPTIYALPYSPQRLSGGEALPFVLEEVFLRENPDLRVDAGCEGGVGVGEGDGEEVVDGGVDLGNVDEGAVVEMLRKDLLVPADS